ncbi:hypothetical protein BOX15_Mlig017441g2 [Macrostomum lignano]|uniref:Uncharacterized protein n=1 Tax=Macrostomum lignano TaxID=282301 RepID=A0A267GRD4_9PLAT|nr:hypothetical protein BOX15_Mlig017441g1 [Macrostomum lignano]PAA92081.1 hypothetical protein BOX15_Mlig017441g2 [Macrostomum lignano]
MSHFDATMYNWHYGVLPKTAKLAFTPAQTCILKDYLVVLDSNMENLFIFNRTNMQLESQIGTGICDLTVSIFPVSENESNLMVLVSGSLVQLLNMANIHMESVNNVFEYSFVEIKCRDGSIASLWTDRCASSYLVLWLSCKDNPLIYELFDDSSPKIVFDRLEWVTADRLLLVRAGSVPICFSVFSLAARSFLNHVVMNIGCGPQNFAVSSNNKRLVLCQDGNFIVYDTGNLKRLLCCKCDLAEDSMDFIGLFQNNFMTVGQLTGHKVVRYYINEEYCSVDRVNEGKVSFESYDRFKSVQPIGDELLVVRCTSRDQRSVVLGLINHFDGNVFQFLKLRLGDMLSLTQSCLVTFSKKSAADRHFELALFDFTAPAAPDDLWPRLKQKLAEIRKHKKSLQDYSISKQRHVQQLMRAKMLELNRSHLNELKRIAKNPVYMSKAAAQDESVVTSRLVSHSLSEQCPDEEDQLYHQQQKHQHQQKQQQQQQKQQLHAIWENYYQRCGGLRDGDSTGVATAAAQQQEAHNSESIVIKSKLKQQVSSGSSGSTPLRKQRKQ